MNKFIVSIASALVLFNIASANISTFDGLGDGNDLSNYGGFNWSNMYSNTYDTYNNWYSNSLTPVSGDGLVYNGFGASASVSHSSFNFDGAYLTGWTYNNADWWGNAHSVTINGYNNGNLVKTFVADLDLANWKYFDVGMDNVDNVTFTSDNGSFLMDNFKTNVPEPGMLSMFFFGITSIAGCVALRKRV